jgi:methionyl-tRNA formyltransferase
MTSHPQKIAFFGTPDFTTDFLDTLAAIGYIPAFIVTNPDKPVGRGMQLHAPAPKIWGMKKNIPVLQPEKITQAFIENLQKENFDLFIVVAYGKILPESLINTPAFGTINVHYSLLPKYRGATPVEAAILAGDTTTGVCIQQMVYMLDAGNIIAQKEISIDPKDTTLTLRSKLNIEALAILPQTLSDIFNTTINPIPQDETLATKTKKIQKVDCEISLAEAPDILDKKYRAYPSLFFYTEKHDKIIRVKITNAHYTHGVFTIESVIPENGKNVSFGDFLQGLYLVWYLILEQLERELLLAQLML